MFFDGAKKELLVTPFLVSSTDAKQVHYKSVLTTNKMAFLYTKNLTFCVGIGFKHYAEDKSIDKIAIYHSVSEHSSECSQPKFIETALKTKNLTIKEEQVGQNFVRAVYEFLKSVEDSKKIEVVLHINETFIDSYQIDRDAVHETLKAVWYYLHPLDKADINFSIKVQTGGAVFAMTNQEGPAHHELAAKAVCYRIVAYTKELSWFMHHRCANIIDQAEKSKYSWQFACKKIYEQAKDIPFFDKHNQIYDEIVKFLEELDTAKILQLDQTLKPQVIKV